MKAAQNSVCINSSSYTEEDRANLRPTAAAWCWLGIYVPPPVLPLIIDILLKLYYQRSILFIRSIWCLVIFYSRLLIPSAPLAPSTVARGGTPSDCRTRPIKEQLMGVAVHILKLNRIPHNTAHLPAILFHIYSNDGRGCACTEAE